MRPTYWLCIQLVVPYVVTPLRVSRHHQAEEQGFSCQRPIIKWAKHIQRGTDNPSVVHIVLQYVGTLRGPWENVILETSIFTITGTCKHERIDASPARRGAGGLILREWREFCWWTRTACLRVGGHPSPANDTCWIRYKCNLLISSQGRLTCALSNLHSAPSLKCSTRKLSWKSLIVFQINTLQCNCVLCMMYNICTSVWPIAL